ncbi:MAG: SprT-like family protein [Gemmataceae bacterium]|nr:SprT-like family protein [Gemmataceae bacterium]
MVEVTLPPSKDPDEVRRWALGVMAAFRLDGWRLEFTRAVRLLGVCRYRSRVIGLSRHLVERNPPEQVRETLLHECAHALVGPGHGHGPVWKKVAIEIGCRPERCSRADLDMPEGRWRAICGGCGTEYRRHRRPRRARYHCRRCGRERGQLAWNLSFPS